MSPVEKTAAVPADSAPLRLPLWRLIAAILVLAGMAGVLLALAPVYLEDLQLLRYVRSLAHSANAASLSDDALRSAVLTRARQLDLPVESGDIRISHTDGKLQLEMKYAVQMDFPLYQVDLHFHPAASSR
jgi:hypothetical protein